MNFNYALNNFMEMGSNNGTTSSSKTSNTEATVTRDGNSGTDSSEGQSSADFDPFKYAQSMFGGPRRKDRPATETTRAKDAVEKAQVMATVAEAQVVEAVAEAVAEAVDQDTGFSRVEKPRKRNVKFRCSCNFKNF